MILFIETDPWNVVSAQWYIFKGLDPSRTSDLDGMTHNSTRILSSDFYEIGGIYNTMITNIRPGPSCMAVSGYHSSFSDPNWLHHFRHYEIHKSEHLAGTELNTKYSSKLSMKSWA